MGDRPPKDTTEVYAREQIMLHERQSTEVVVQAVRIGDIGIATTPTETYALTGLKLKLQSPLPKTMVIELANGGDGYIPPPEQHAVGRLQHVARSIGGTRGAGRAEESSRRRCSCWKRRRAGLGARFKQSCGPAAAALLKAKPAAYWRLDEWPGPLAVDAAGQSRDAVLRARRGVLSRRTSRRTSCARAAR